MDTKDQHILALGMKIEELEKDKAALLKCMKALEELAHSTYERDAECPYCKQKHWEMHEHACF